MNFYKINRLTRTITKISLFLGLIILFQSCDAVKRVGENEFLLTENTIIVDGEEISDEGVNSQLLQKPNTTIPLIKLPLGLIFTILQIQNPIQHSALGFTENQNEKPI